MAVGGDVPEPSAAGEESCYWWTLSKFEFILNLNMISMFASAVSALNWTLLCPLN